MLVKTYILPEAMRGFASVKAFTDYVDNLCGPPCKVDYDAWLKKLNRVVDSSVEKGKMV